MNAINGSISEPKDTEYDEFKQYDNNISEMKASETSSETPHLIEPVRRELTQEEKDSGAKLIINMSIEELRDAVQQLMIVNTKYAEKMKDYEQRATQVHQIWWSKREIKAQLERIKNRNIPRATLKKIPDKTPVSPKIV